MASGDQSEREFYLREFRGRTLAIAMAPGAVTEDLTGVLRDLVAGRAQVLLLTRERAALEKILECRWLDAESPSLETDVWRALQALPRLGIALSPDVPVLASVRSVALRLGVFKLVWVDPLGGLVREDGGRRSFVDLEELRSMLAGPLALRRSLVVEVETLLARGIPAVNACSPAGLSDELFSYAGSGTLFTRDRYVRVRSLGVDDFDAAVGLVSRGVEEGYLLPRSPEDLDRVLTNGFGAFVAGRHLAGIGAVLVHSNGRSGEIASLYAITRFLGEGIGTHLVTHATERARSLGLHVLFACTTSERAEQFFHRQGFRSVDPERLPDSRWDDYPANRRAGLVCLARDL